MAKGFANAGITLAVGTLITGGLLAVAAPALVAIGVGLVISSALSFGYDWLYDHRKGKK
ncbi:hypothetical protein [Lactococcus lactis]|uniref:hypothetical protein n=1 Tax=Lactococcus lactis TaxID=1358 RepID=UPI0021A4D8BD|nr:hypothetical protein [Lactococcus lactis]MDT2851341.1 hypothetical protein [Lactococcus lactis]